MTDQTFNQTAETTASRVRSLLAWIVSPISRTASTQRPLTTEPTDRAWYQRELPTSERQCQDIGVREEYSRHDARNNVADICARNGLPL